MENNFALTKEELEQLTAVEAWEKLYNKELNSKKNILEYVEITRIFKKLEVNPEKIQDTYSYIYGKIEDLKEKIKPNTMMFLKNNLKSQLGKYVVEKDPKPINHFIEFFKEAYPENNRRKDFTWVIMDVNKISEEQLWTTLTYINKECMNHDLRLSLSEKRNIIEVIELVVKRNNSKFISNLRNLKSLTDVLNIKIVSVGEIFKVKKF
ncbi:hypothetical protein [Clostridium fungisolvens]|uniref:Uncharacterized protein n=1 Tax=Clostridium fungisolvens TaxID=1604897 RepID=A0A6V8SF19_9CLOT|nr:hypothetical protein [Clostridium fungisolvens]GFP75809.1 hypothetical protein bsdtw1_01901 [Clostridium fungisolvens]